MGRITRSRKSHPTERKKPRVSSLKEKRRRRRIKDKEYCNEYPECYGDGYYIPDNNGTSSSSE